MDLGSALLSFQNRVVQIVLFEDLNVFLNHALIDRASTVCDHHGCATRNKAPVRFEAFFQFGEGGSIVFHIDYVARIHDLVIQLEGDRLSCQTKKAQNDTNMDDVAAKPASCFQS